MAKFIRKKKKSKIWGSQIAVNQPTCAHKNPWCSIIPDATLRFKKKSIFQTASFVKVQLLCIVIALKGKVSDISEYNEEHGSLIISPQQSGQWLRRGRRESRILYKYKYTVKLRLDRSG